MGDELPQNDDAHDADQRELHLARKITQRVLPIVDELDGRRGIHHDETDEQKAEHRDDERDARSAHQQATTRRCFHAPSPNAPQPRPHVPET